MALFWQYPDVDLRELYASNQYKKIADYVEDNKTSMVMFSGSGSPSEMLDNLEFGSTQIDVFRDDSLKNNNKLNAVFNLGVLKGYVESFAMTAHEDIRDAYILSIYDRLPETRSKKFFTNMLIALFKSPKTCLSHKELADLMGVSERTLSNKFRKEKRLSQIFFSYFIHCRGRIVNRHKYFDYFLQDYGLTLFHLLEKRRDYKPIGGKE